MRTRILTMKERQAIEKYMKADGEKATLIRVIATRVRQNLKHLKEELALLERFNARYTAKNGRG
ncbi:MAG: hypothetical protein ABSA92_13915 [Candidatus Bathyarchaeia archaeon]